MHVKFIKLGSVPRRGNGGHFFYNALSTMSSEIKISAWMRSRLAMRLTDAVRVQAKEKLKLASKYYSTFKTNI